MIEVTPPARLNWRDVMEDLSGAGITAYRIAEMFEIERSTVQRWGELTTDMGFGYGRALLALHSTHCGLDRTLQRLTEAQRL